jgi:hydroxypyruvate reductase
VTRDLLIAALSRSLRQFTRYPRLRKELQDRETKAPLHILAIGKAAWQMASVALTALAPDMIESCIVLTKHGFYPGHSSKFRQKESDFVAYADETSAILSGDPGNPKCQILEAGHPVPDENSILHTKAILKHLQNIPEHEELIILLSGGTSALFELPAPGYTLEDIIGLNRLLLGSGLDISQMNQKRRELSQVKGGKALSHIRCQIPAVYLLSDVEGNDPAIIGSGPFYGTGARRSAESVERQCDDTSCVETPSWRFVKDSTGKMLLPQQDSTRTSVETKRSSVKGSDVVTYADEDVCNPIPHLIVGDNQAFLKVLKRSLQESCPLPVRLSSRFINLETGAFAKALSNYLPKAKPGIYLFGGELTFKPQGSGKGGRCCHLALLMAKEICNMPGTIFFAYATDGNDNIDESAGAIVDEHSWQKMIDAGIDPEQAIRNCDSYSALKAIDAIFPGAYTGTNVNEVYGLLRNEMGHCVTRWVPAARNGRFARNGLLRNEIGACGCESDKMICINRDISNPQKCRCEKMVIRHKKVSDNAY